MAKIERTKTSPLPPYSEMILTAIKALDEKTGSNKSSICRYLESKYAEQLPDSFYNLMVAHLARMKECGEIVIANNNYYVPGTYAPSSRGRGRPPKSKDPSAQVEVGPPKPKRERGRPPKSENETDATTKSKGRGRPSKKSKSNGENVADAKSNDDAKLENASDAKLEDEPTATPKSRGRGRPSKKSKGDEENVAPKSEVGANGGSVKKGRGRPPKLGI